jgi:hypothetical protein
LAEADEENLRDEATKTRASRGEQEGEATQSMEVAVAALHCGAGCVLGDMIGEIMKSKLGIVFAGAFGSELVLDFLWAYLLGIGFQYFTIAPMRGLSFREGLRAAVRADTISISMFEIGMFGWMALSYFVLFPSPHLEPTETVFWFMMQIAMIIGFLMSYPANQWLLNKAWKERMLQPTTVKKVETRKGLAA